MYRFLTQSTCTRYSHQLWAPSTDNGNSGLKFPKFHVQNGLVPLQNLNPKIAYIPAAQTRPKPMCIILVIVLVSRIQKSSTEDINFVKWKRTFWFNHLKWPDRSKWTTFKVGPEYSSQTKPKWFVPYDVPTEISGILGWVESALCFHF